MGKTKILVFWLWNFWYAILNHLDRNINYNEYSLFAFDKNINLINNFKENKKHIFLHTNNKVSDNIVFSESIEDCLKDVDVLILAISSDSLLCVLEDIFKYISDSQNIILLNSAKALSKNWLTYSTEIKKKFYNKNYSFWVFSGWTIAKDLFDGNLLWATIAFSDLDIAETTKKIFKSKNLYIDISSDVLGTEYAWAFKNVWAILAWYIKWKWLPYWTETFYLTQFSKEVKRLVVDHLWWDKETFDIDSQCRWNDFWLSCVWSTRNREFWELLGNWLKFDEALSKMQNQNKIVEWVNTLKSLDKILNTQIIKQQKFPILSSCISFLTDDFKLNL